MHQTEDRLLNTVDIVVKHWTSQSQSLFPPYQKGLSLAVMLHKYQQSPKKTSKGIQEGAESQRIIGHLHQFGRLPKQGEPVPLFKPPMCHPLNTCKPNPPGPHAIHYPRRSQWRPKAQSLKGFGSWGKRRGLISRGAGNDPGAKYIIILPAICATSYWSSATPSP